MDKEEIILSELEDIKQYLTNVQDNLNLFADCLTSFLSKRSKIGIPSKLQKMMAQELIPSIDNAIQENSITPKDVKNIVDGHIDASALRSQKDKSSRKQKRQKK